MTLSLRVVGSLLMTSMIFGVACGKHTQTDTIAAKSSALTASFDWSMPDRTRIDTTNTLVPIDVNPASWDVDFTACAAGAGATQFRWSFGDGKQQTVTTCQVTHGFPSEGIYTVSLTVVAADGSTATTSQTITVQDFLLIGLGDSYGSGEGSPNVEIPPNLFQDWANLGVEIGQDEAQRTHVTDVLSAIDSVLGPVENLLTAISIRDAVNCSVCSPDGIEEGLCFAGAGGLGFPAICLLCKSDCHDAEGRVASATLALAEAVGKAAKVEGLEQLQNFVNDPTGLKTQLDLFKSEFEAALSTLNDTIQALRGKRDLIPNTAAVKWNDSQCHRSSFSAQAQTALALEAADPKSTVTFIHLACSGAKSTDLYTAGYTGISSGAALPAQLTAALAAAKGREVDALLLSVGGNDANFAPIIFAGITQEPTNDPGSPLFTKVDEVALGIQGFCALTYFFSDKCFAYFDAATAVGLGPPGLQLYNEGVAKLPDAYTAVDQHLKSTFADLNRDPSRIFITQYPNATRDEQGNFCGPRLDRLPDIADIPGWSTTEWQWAGETVIPGINGAGQAAKNAHGWTLVDGIFADFTQHGLCADDNWINRIQQSFTHQGDSNGAVHPNRAGYAKIALRETAAVQANLFSGPAGTPRPPRVPPVADAGGPIVVNEGSDVPLTNNSFDPARTGILTFQWSLAVTPSTGASLTSTVAPAPTLHALDDATGAVNVTVTNGNGSSSASASVVINNVAPVVNAGPDVKIVTGVPFTLPTSFVDPGLQDTHTAQVNWGDGVTTNTAVAPNARNVSPVHTYTNPGTFTVQVTVRDDDGGQGTDTVVVTVIRIGDILGFEQAGTWSSPQVSVAETTSPRTQGAFGLAVSGQGFLEISSIPFATAALTGVTSRLAYDLFIPTNPPNPFWVGATQLYVTCPSANMYNRYIGQVELTGKPLGAFSTISYALPADVVAVLRGSFSDLSLKIVLNVNRPPTPFVLDNVRFIAP